MKTVMVDETGGENFRESRAAKIAFHRVLEEELAENVKNQRNENEQCRNQGHNFSSIRATGFATIRTPIKTSAIPHQR